MPEGSRGRKAIRPIRWGDASIGGPRHYFRESFMAGLLVRRCPPPADVLDAGCGSGTLTLRLLARGYRVVSFDPSGDFLAGLRSRLPAGFRGRSRLLAAAAERIPLARDSVQAVACGEVLEHLEDDRRAIGEFFRVLRPGGACLVSVPVGPRLWDENDEWAGHCRRYDRGELEGKFEEFGFRVERVRWWGFPLLLPYHRWVYMPWARRAMRRPLAEAHGSAVARLGKSRPVSLLLGEVFRLERIFSMVPLGIGMWLLARKP